MIFPKGNEPQSELLTGVEMSWHFPALGKASNSFRASRTPFCTTLLGGSYTNLAAHRFGSGGCSAIGCPVPCHLLLAERGYRFGEWSGMPVAALKKPTLSSFEPVTKACRLCHSRLNRQHLPDHQDCWLPESCAKSSAAPAPQSRKLVPWLMCHGKASGDEGFRE